MRCAVAALVGLMAVGLAAAQTSTNYKLEEHTFNAGGHPESGTVLTSAGYRMTMDALGESIVGRDLSSASYSMDGSFGAGYPPPGEALNLRFTNATTLVWDPEESVGVYNLYRDWLSTLSGLAYGNCEQQALSDETATDSDTPTPVGRGFFYLVTAENRLNEEGTKGQDSSDDERPNPSPCP
jgi:hypothetical protein